MAKQLVSDELWSLVQPLLPPKPAHPKGGHPFTVPDRAALTGIVFVLKTGLPWEYLPQEMGCGSGMTCWRRLREWQEAGVWTALHRVLVQRLADADRIDWSRASADGARVPAKKGARAPGRARSTGASPARTTTWWPTAAASRWRPSPRRPT
jgi:transposase